MPELPSGTVTFLFTDVEGSTRLLHELGAEGYAAALGRHRRLLRAAFAAHEGVEVDTQGDAFFVAFPTAPGALAAAAELTKALAEGPIRVRVGIHTGTPFLAEEGYVGMDVNRAARIAAAGHGAQVLVSASTAALADGLELRDLGEHRFKDLAAADRVFQLGVGEFPPLQTLFHTNLPVPATTFLGRETELAGVVELLTRQDVRLLTLTGPGGTGKTRLALQAAAESEAAFPEGLWWVSLSPLRDPALVLPVVAGVLGVREEPGRELGETLARDLGGKHLLLLLDNAEHLLPDVATTIATLRDLEGATVLVTSRERLRLQGEHLYPVTSLEEPDGIALFVARAWALEPTFVHTPHVDELCRRLDQLPLAIELAAARTTLFSPEQLVARLGQRLDLLQGSRDADPRQQTLRGTIAWSHDLLDGKEQRLFRQLAVFAGGCTFEAAESVCGADPDTLQSLLDKSLLRRRVGLAGEPRYWMLETIREFAGECLAAAGEGEESRRRHALHYADLAASNSLARRRFDPDAFDLMEAEFSNLRAGLGAAIEGDDANTSALYLFGLLFHWLHGGLGREAATAARAWLRLPRPADPTASLAGVVAVGEILRFTSDPATAIDLKREALELVRAIPDSDLFGWKITGLTAALHTDLASLLIESGCSDEARRVAKEGLALRRRLGDSGGIAHALLALVEIEESEGRFERAYELAREALAEGGLPVVEMAALRAWSAEYALIVRDFSCAAATLSQACEETGAQRDPTNDAALLRVGAMLALHVGENERALIWLAAVVRLDEDTGISNRSRSEVERDVASLARLRDLLDAETFARSERAGREARIEELVDELRLALERWQQGG